MDTERSPSARDRKLRNLLIAPSKQFKLAIFAVLFGMALFLGFFAFELWVITAVAKALLVHIPDPTQLDIMLKDSIRTSWIAFVSAGIVSSSIVVATIFIITHRFYGPEIALRKHVEALTRGDYAHRTHLRKTDEFKEIASGLNKLSSHLESGLPDSIRPTNTAPQ